MFLRRYLIMDFLTKTIADELTKKIMKHMDSITQKELKLKKKDKMEELMYQYNGYTRNFLLCTKYNSFDTDKKYDFDNARHYFLKMNCIFPRLELFSDHTTKYVQNHLDASQLYFNALINGTYEELDKGIQKDNGRYHSRIYLDFFDECDKKELTERVVTTGPYKTTCKLDTREVYEYYDITYDVNIKLPISIQHWQLLDILTSKILKHMKLDISKI